MTSISEEYYQVLLAQGICVGLGSGCLFIPSIAVVSTYFTTKRAFATGIAVAGSSVGTSHPFWSRCSELIFRFSAGGIIYPIVFRQLQPVIGFGWATRVLGFISFAVLCIPVSVMKMRMTPKKKRALLLPSAFKNIPYTLHTVGVMFGFVGLYFPIFYIQVYTLARIPVSVDYAFYLLSILNAASVFGRIIPNFLADKVGAFNLLVPCTFAAGILVLCWIDVVNIAGITVFTILYGFFSGAFVSLIPPAVVKLCPDLSEVGTWLGMSLSVGALGLLFGNPIAGVLVDIPNKQFVTAQGLTGGFVILGALLIGSARILRGRQLDTWKI